MPPIVSLKHIGEAISSTTKAFDDLYSTLRRVAIDGWNGIGVIIAEIKTARDERKIRELVIALRSLQLAKIEAATALQSSICGDHNPRNRILVALEGALHAANAAQGKVRQCTNVKVPMILGERYPELARGLTHRGILVDKFLEDHEWRSKPVPLEYVPQFEDLIDLLDKNAGLVGKCADLLTAYKDQKHNERLSAP